MSSPFALAFEDMPEELIVFPLPGALLLPHGRLPLNIFEERYLNMVEDALSQQRLIGMVQTREMYNELVPDGAPLYDIGCAGRIVSFTETEDGRMLLTLAGICRYRITGEAEGRRGYRRVHADYAPFHGDMEPDGWQLNREHFNPLLQAYLDSRGIKVNWQTLERTDDHMLIATLGMMCPFDYKEKQALLEADNTAHMAEIMSSLMEMAIQGTDQSTVKH